MHCPVLVFSSLDRKGKKLSAEELWEKIGDRLSMYGIDYIQEQEDEDSIRKNYVTKELEEIGFSETEGCFTLDYQLYSTRFDALVMEKYRMMMPDRNFYDAVKSACFSGLYNSPVVILGADGIDTFKNIPSSAWYLKNEPMELVSVFDCHM